MAIHTVEIYVKLPEEGGSACPTKAVDLGNGLFKLLPTPNYNPEDEVWEFLPHSIVRVKVESFENKKYLLAVAKV